MFVAGTLVNQTTLTLQLATNRGHTKRLKIGSVPSRFQWNNWGLPRRESVYKRASTRLGHDVLPALPLEQPLPCVEEPMEEIAASVVMTEHDFGSAPKPGLSVFVSVLKYWPTITPYCS